MTLIEAAKQALEALEWNLLVIEDYGDKEQLNRQHRAITALRTAIEAAKKQEPVAWINGEGRDWSLLEATQESLREHMAEIKRLKAAQPAPAPGYCKHCKQYTIEEPLPAAQRQWVGLTDEEAMQTWELVIKYAPSEVRLKDFARLIQDKLKEKNGV